MTVENVTERNNINKIIVKMRVTANKMKANKLTLTK
jgi:hypothetical protein